MKKLLTQNRYDLACIIFLLLFVPLFFYNLGEYSLVDFDEAWFAEVARNILTSGNPFVLTFNGLPFNEHPPFGFWLMDIAFLLSGVNEFSARFFSAALGFGSVIITYFIGKKMFNRTIGLIASLVLLSSVWFIFRARSANLDTVFLFFYLFSFYSVLKLKTNPHWIYILSASLAAATLTKMLIGVSILIPIIFYVFYYKISIPLKSAIKSLLLFAILVLPYLVANYIYSGGLLFLEHIYKVGTRPENRILPNLFDLPNSLTFQYLHFGIRKWYYPAIIALFGSVFFVRLNKQIIPIYSILVFLFIGFLTNEKTEIWHLIPLYPFLGLLIGFFMFNIVKVLIEFLKLKRLHTIAPFLLLALVCIVTFTQIYAFRNEVKLFDHDISGLAGTANVAQKYSEPLYLNADYFLPSSVFYSQKKVLLVKGEGFSLSSIIENGPKPFLLITEDWKLKADKITTSNYELLSQHKEYVLIRIK